MNVLLHALRRLYAASLLLLPADIRRRHAAEMRATSNRLVEEALRRRGALAAVRAAAAECADVIGAALRVSRRAPGELRQDVAYAWRLMWARPAFTATIVATLAIGIGSTTTVFTAVNALLLRPLPYAEPDRLALLVPTSSRGEGLSMSPRDFHDMPPAIPSIASAAAFTDEQVNLTGDVEPERVDSALVTVNFFDVVGAPMQAGRGFRSAEGEAGADGVVVISDALWQRRFGARGDVLGERVVLDGQPHTIVGVAAPAMTFPGRPQIWRPLVFTQHQLDPTQRGARWISVVAKLKPGVHPDAAAGEVRRVGERFAAEFPRTHRGRGATVRPLQAHLVHDARTGLLALLAAVTLVLLIACANVANLLLVRSAARSGEMSLRMALGATRGRLLRQCLSENLFLTALASAAGLALAAWGTRLIVRFLPESLPRVEEIRMDWVVAAFACGAAVAVAFVLGLVAAVGIRVNASAHQARVTSGGAKIMRRAFVVAEVAMALVLLSTAGLFVKSLFRLYGVSPGFDAANVLTFSITMPKPAYPEPDQLIAYVERTRRDLETLPGIGTASAIFGLPLTDEFGAASSFVRIGRPPDPDDEPMAALRVATPGYFATMRIPLTSGRDFTDRDTRHTPGVAIINEAAARRYWPGENPIGQSLRLGVGVSPIRQTPREIVGVARDVRYRGLEQAPQPEVYVPYAQHPVDGLVMAVRTHGEPRRAIPDVRALLRRLDPNMPMSDVATMEEIVAESVAARRFSLTLLSAFAGSALLLAAIGIYGVLSYTVTLRTREIGVRVAMGAARLHVLGLVVGEGLGLAAAGMALGAGVAAAAAEAVAGLLYDVRPWDPTTFALVGAMLVLVSAAASYVPARRAAAVDPIAALRSE